MERPSPRPDAPDFLQQIEQAIAALKAGELIPLSGGEAAYAAQIALDALAGAGFSVVSTGDLRSYLYRSVDLTESERAAMNRLREIAGPERGPDA